MYAHTSSKSTVLAFFTYLQSLLLQFVQRMPAPPPEQERFIQASGCPKNAGGCGSKFVNYIKLQDSVIPA